MEIRLIEMMKKLKSQGMGFRKISETLGISSRQVRKYLMYRNTKELHKSFDFDKVVELLKSGKNHNDIARELRPDRSQTFYYNWKENLPEEQQQILANIRTNCRKDKLKEEYIDRSFKYEETNEDSILPIGLK